MLAGMRVIELSTDVAGAFASRLLALYGADVITVEPPEGHPTRWLTPRLGDDSRDPELGALFAYLGAGKRSIVLDLNTAEDRERLHALIAGADAVIESHAPGALAALGIDLDAIGEEQPGLVVTSITPYGQTGPKAGWRATALTAFAAGGQMSICGDADQPPLKTAGYQAYYQGGLHGFAATATALAAAARSGIGDHIDISLQEVQASTLEGQGPGALTRGSEAMRSGNTARAAWGIHPSADGWIGLASMPRQSYSVYDCIGHPELKEDPTLASAWGIEANELLQVLVPEWTSTRTSAEIFAESAKFRAPFSMIPTPRELLEWQGLRDVDFWREVEHPTLGSYTLPGGPIEFTSDDREHDRGRATPAPLLGQHTEEVLAELAGADSTASAGDLPTEVTPPLDGIRVVDVTQVWAGPYGTRFLADMGAEVIKVEGPTFADPIRTMGGATTPPEINLSAYFNEYNRNKLGISLDLKEPSGLEALKGVIAASDVFIENWSSGVAERLGLGYEDVRSLNPGIIYISMPGFGHRGADSARVGFGPTIEQMGGLVALQGYEGGPPHRSGISYGDPIAGTAAAGAVAVGIVHRERTGEGCYAVVPQRDVIINLVGEYMVAESLDRPVPTRIGNRDLEFAPHNVYRARDEGPRPVMMPSGEVMAELSERWVAIAVDSDAAWAALRQVIGDDRLDDARYVDAAGRRAHADAIDRVIEEWTRDRDAEEVAANLQAEGVAAASVLTPLLATRDAHLEARGMFLTYDHADAGHQRTAAPPWHMRRRPVTALRPAPRFGEHSEQVLRDVAGYDDGAIEEMASGRVTTRDLTPSAAG
jgi:crotonobetainyl-CoA:carnitine CoA-transferase CaiB-like acyl-CoA transferase